MLRVFSKICFFFCVFIASPLKADLLDSLKRRFETADDLNQKAYFAGKVILGFNTYDSVSFYYKKYSAFFRSKKDKFGEAYLNYATGSAALETAEYDECKDLLNKSTVMFLELNNDSMVAKTYMRLGFVQYTLGDFETSTKTYYNALEIAERINKPQIQSWAYNLLGLNFSNRPHPDYKKSLEYLFKALEIDNKINNNRNKNMVLLRIGTVYGRLDDFAKAEYYLGRSMRLADSLKMGSGKKWTLAALGLLYKREKKYAKAIEIEHQSLQISRESNEMPGVIISYLNVADIYRGLKDYKLAESYVDSSLEVSLRTKIYQTLPNVYLIKSLIYEEKGETAKALEFYKKSVDTKDSLFSIENNNNINHLETKYQTQKKEQEILLLNQEKETDQKIKNIYIIALCAAAALICFIIYSLLRINRAKKLIALQKLETEKQKDLVVEKQKDITDSINYALRIQEAILPAREISKDIIKDSFVLFKQKDIVSGDFYWYHVKNNKCIITAVDCTGHGVPGALMSMLGMSFLKEIVDHLGITKPVSILSELRDRVKDTLKQTGSEGESKDGMDMALISVERETLKMEFCGANNPLWIFRTENGNTELIELDPDKRPVGYFRGLGIPFTNKEFQLKPGDSVYLFTDGYADQFGGPKGKKFKYKQLQGLLAVIGEEPMKEQHRILSETFDKWKGNLEQVDDVCIIGLRF